MDIEQLVKLAVDNSVTIVIVIYFLIYNWKFTDQIQSTQVQLIEAVKGTNEVVKELKSAIEKLLEK